jgi:hypothetical protein
MVDETGKNCSEVPISNEIKFDAYLNLTFALRIPLLSHLGTLQASFCLSFRENEKEISEPI